jgi:hypothetical protein
MIRRQKSSMTTIEIFRPGTFTDMKGHTLSFSAADLAATAAAYDPAKGEAPLVVGHPTHDAPAFGWVRGVSFANGSLTVDPDQVEPAFAAAVRDGRFKKVSPSFYSPTSPDNPVKGVWYLRHVGFLGAAVPAVTGLKPVAFAGGGDDIATLEFAAPQTEEVPVSDPKQAADAARVAELEAELAKKNAESASFAAQLAAVQLAADKSFVDGLVKSGTLPTGLAPAVVSFMATLNGTDTVEFAAPADGKPAKTTGREQFRAILGALPKMVDFGALPAGTDADVDTASFAAPTGFQVDQDRLALHQKVLAYQAKHPGVTYDAALAAVR